MLRTMTSPRVRSMAHELPGQVVQTPGLPAGGDAADAVVVGRRAPQAERRRGGEVRVHEEAHLIHRDLARRGGCGRRAVGGARPADPAGTGHRRPRTPRAPRPRRVPSGTAWSAIAPRPRHPRAPATARSGPPAHPARPAEGARSPDDTDRPSISRSHVAVSQSSGSTSPRFSTSTRWPASISGVARARTGAARWRCSRRAGFGVRSGKSRPSTQKSSSLGWSPKSPP